MIRYLLPLLLIIAPASAIVNVQQGDIIYMNETYDITQAVSYPTYQLAWCAANNADCDPPDQVIDTENGNLEKYPITTIDFKYGTYYRWDGEWHPAENSVAFTIIPGKRPKATLPNITVDAPAQIKPQEPEGPFRYIVARGDTVTLSTRLYSSDTCHLWFFADTDKMYDVPMSTDNGTYDAGIGSSFTSSLNTGTYNGYIQCDGNNGLQDIFYTNKTFDTPYDDEVVPDVQVEDWNLLNARRQFDELKTKVPKFDDKLYPVVLEIADPETTVTDVQQDEDNLFISGVTTWSSGTAITLRLDPDNYPLQYDRDMHTWQTFAKGHQDAQRAFATAIPFEKKDLFIGTHEIAMTVDKNSNTAVSSYTFKVTDVYVMPTPTPEARRMIYGKDWEEIPVKVVPTTTINANKTVVIEEPVVFVEENVTANVTVNTTTTVTANVTIPSTTIPVAENTIPTVPLGPAIAISSVVILCLMRK